MTNRRIDARPDTAAAVVPDQVSDALRVLLESPARQASISAAYNQTLRGISGFGETENSRHHRKSAFVRAITERTDITTEDLARWIADKARTNEYNAWIADNPSPSDPHEG